MTELGRWIYSVILGRPLMLLYIHGPNLRLGLFEVGFHGGNDEASICAALTGVRAAHWSIGDECSALIQKRVDSFGLSLLIMLYFYSLLRAVAFSATMISHRVARTPLIALGSASAAGA